MMTRRGRAARMTLALLLALAVIAGGVRIAAAQSATTKASPRLVVAETTSIEARLDVVDVKTRRMTVTGPHRKTLTLKVGPDVRDLDQLRPGDQLVVRYFEPLALFVRKANEPRVAAESAAVQVMPKGKRPVPLAVDTVELKGTVEAIGHAKRRLTLTGPEGKTRTLKVDPSVKRFDEVQKGDQIVVRHTEAIAFSIRKA